jgi:cytochrome c553
MAANVMTGLAAAPGARTGGMAALSVCTLLLLLALTGCGQREGANTKPAAPATQPASAPAADPAAGQAIARRNCVSCHLDDGAGAAPGIPQLGRQNAAYLVQSMQQYAAASRRHAVLKDMTPQLSDADVRNVAAYYASLSIPAAEPVSAEQAPTPYERGKAMAAACAGCHGADGNSTTAGIPSLAGQQPIFLLAALSEYHRGDRSPPAVQSMLRRADAVELESLALYFAAQTPATRTAQATGDAVAGEALALRCTGCHGWRGVSDDAATPMLAGQDPMYLGKALRGYGKSRHHASMERQLGPLGEKEIRDIAAYFAAQKGRASHAAGDRVAQMAANCDRCHGNAAAQEAAAAPRIRGQDKDYLVIALRSYRDDRRASSTMHKMSLPFSETTIEALATHYARQLPQ